MGHSALSTAVGFVGRERELAALRAQLDAALADTGSRDPLRSPFGLGPSRAKPQVVLLAGEPGIGKTRLAEELAALARDQGAAVLWGRCYEGEWAPPYGPWVAALGDYARTVAPDHLRRQLGPAAPLLARLVPHVRAALPDLAAPAPLSPEEERFRLYDAVTQSLLAAAQAQPIMLVLDDLHWADGDSLGLLRHVARFADRGRLLLVGVYRDLEVDRRHPLTDVPAVLLRETDYVRIRLRGLSEPEVAQYLARATGQEPLPRALIRQIYAETEGNPFYLREVVRHLVDEGKLVRRAGRWVPGERLGELGIPEGVRQVVGRRVVRLSAATNTVLRLAAAFAGGFEFRVLQALSDLPENTLLDCIEEALAAGLIRAAGERPGAETYDFVHAIVRHTLYDELSPSRRVRLHRRIAAALERVSAGREQAHAAELATQYHASAALPGADRGIPHALAAAEQAKAAYAQERAVLFLRMARDLAAESAPATHADILCRLAVAEAETLMLAEAERTAADALAALAAAGTDPNEVARFLVAVSRALKDGGASHTVWEPLVERGLALVGAPRDLTWARLTLLLDPIEPDRSGPIRAGRWLGFDPQAVAIAQSGGDEDDYARTLEPFDWRTREETAAILALARTWQRPGAVMRALNVGARELLYRHGAFREAADVAAELLATAERYGSVPQQADAQFHLCGAHTALGEFALAQGAAERAKELRVRLGMEHRVRALNSLLTCYLDDDWGGLIEALGPLLTDPRSARLPILVASFGWLALAYERVGASAEARRLLGILTPPLQRTPPTAWVQNGAVGQAATAAWSLGDRAFAATYRRLALDLIAAGVGDFPTTSNELTVARMATLLGDMAEAREYFARARTVLDVGGQHPLRAIADYDEALARTRNAERGTRSRRPDAAHTSALLEAALAAFRELSMTAWTRRAEELQRTIAAPGSALRAPRSLTA